MVKAIDQIRLYYLEVGGDIEIAWGIQAVVADVQNLVGAVLVQRVAGFLQCYLRQNRVT